MLPLRSLGTPEQARLSTFILTSDLLVPNHSQAHMESSGESPAFNCLILKVLRPASESRLTSVAAGGFRSYKIAYGTKV